MNASATPELAPQSPQSATASREGLFINRNFLLLWLGDASSVLGDFIFNTTLVVWIAATIGRGQSWAPLAVSGVFIAASAPAMLIAPLVGALVDRMSKRAAMLGAYIVSALVTLALIPATGLIQIGGLLTIPHSTAWTLGAIYVAVAALAICARFSNPAALAMLGQIVEEPSRAKAMGFLQGSMSLAMLVGPAVAAPLYLAFGAEWALLIDAVSFVIGVVTLLVMRFARSTGAQADTAERRGLGHEMVEGVVFLARSRTLTVLALVTGVAMLGAGALNALDVFFTVHNLHTPLALYGLLSTVFGVGLIAGAVAAGVLAQRIGLARTLWISTILVGALVIVYSRLTSFGAASVALVIMGIPLAALDVAGGPLLLRETPERLVGRVSSLLTPLNTGATLIGAALAGYLDSSLLQRFSAHLFGMTFGPVDTIFCVAGALILVSGVYAMIGLRGVDRSPERRPLTPAATGAEESGIALGSQAR